MHESIALPRINTGFVYGLARHDGHSTKTNKLSTNSAIGMICFPYYTFQSSDAPRIFGFKLFQSKHNEK
jgi:hypothetical protein